MSSSIPEVKSKIESQNAQITSALTMLSKQHCINPETARQIISQCLDGKVKLLIADENIAPILSLDAKEASRLAVPWLKKIAGYSTDLVNTPGIVGKERPLTQPILLLMYYRSQNTEPHIISPAQWVSAVIFPKNYRTLGDVHTGNVEGEVIYYFDSQYTQKPSDMPARFWIFFQLITKGVSFKERIPGTNNFNQIVIAPPFPQGMFYNGSLQQKNPSNSLHWAIYNALMVILTGNTDFTTSLAQNSKVSKIESSNPLQQFPDSKNDSNSNKDKGNMQKEINTISNSYQPVLPAYSMKTLIFLLTANDVAYVNFQEQFQLPSKAPERNKVSQANTVHQKKLEQEEITQKKEEVESKAQNESDHFEKYVYCVQAIQADTLLRDNIAYILRHGKAIQRRVCFLLQGKYGETSALLLQYKQLNKTAIEIIKRRIFGMKMTGHSEKQSINPSENQWPSSHMVESVLKWHEGVELIKQAYGQVEALFLGSQLTPELAKNLEPAFEMVYVGKISLGFKSFAPGNATIQFADAVLQFLKTGQIRHIPSTQAFLEHRAFCAKELCKALDTLSKNNSHQHESIVEKIVVLLKYAIIHQKRSQYQAVDETNESLENLQAFDWQVKARTFAMNIDISNLQQGLCQLEIDVLIEMMSIKNAPERLAQRLEHSRQQSLHSILAWEYAIEQRIRQSKKRWFTFLKKRGKGAIQFLYQASLLSLGANLVHWMGQSVGEAIPEHLKALTTEFMQTSVKWTVFCFTLSPRLSKRSYDLTGRLLKKDNISLLLKGSGISLGALAISAQGLYATTRMLGVTTLSFYGYQRASMPRLLDIKATLIPGYLKFSLTQLSRMINIFTAILETSYFKDPTVLVHALGGLGGSLACTQFAQKYIDFLKTEPSQIPTNETNDQSQILFLLSMTGYELGQWLSEYGLQSYLSLLNQYQLRDNIIARLQVLAEKHDVAEFSVEQNNYATLDGGIQDHWNPLTWLKDNAEKIKMNWREKDGYYRNAECSVHRNETLPQGMLSCNFSILPPRLKG